MPEGYDLHINAKVTIIGDIIATNSPSIFINGGATIEGGICAPESQFDVSGNAEIDGPIYVNFLWMRGTASLGN